MAKTVIGFFRSRGEAEEAINALVSEGYNHSDVSLLAGDRATQAETPAIGPVHSVGGDTEAGRDAFIGGVAGLVAGVLATVLPGVGAILAIGPIAGAIGGLGLGAGVGGVIGLVRDLGVSEDEAEYYMEGMRRGGAMVTLECADDRAGHAESVLKRVGAVDIKEEAEAWRSTGWTGFDREATPERVRRA
jgi:hypothetical protein